MTCSLASPRPSTHTPPRGGRPPRLLLGALLVLLACGGCSVWPFSGGGSDVMQTQPTLSVQVRGQDDMNNGGNPAVVRIYQLAGQTRFTRTPLSRFWRNNREALSQELVSSQELLLYPGENKSVEIDLAENTKYLGVAADLRDPAQEQWRALRSLAEMRPQGPRASAANGPGGTLAVLVGDDRIEVQYVE